MGKPPQTGPGDRRSETPPQGPRGRLSKPRVGATGHNSQTVFFHPNRRDCPVDKCEEADNGFPDKFRNQICNWGLSAFQNDVVIWRGFDSKKGSV